MKEKSMQWWDKVGLSDSYESDPISWFKRVQFAYACNSKKVIYRSYFDGYVKEKDKVLEFLESLEGSQLVMSSGSGVVKNNYDSLNKVYVFEHGVIEIESHRHDKGSIAFDIISVDENFVEKVSDYLKKFTSKIPPQGEVKMLVASSCGYCLTTLGRIESPLVKDNYSDDVIEQYQHIIDEFKSSDPCGRFILFSGPPGTGKSYFIKGILSEIHAWFVFIPSSLVESLSGPEMVSTLLNDSEERNSLPIVLIIEDADSSLESRKTSANGVNQISNLLNIGDGLLGELSDIRIIATTNADTQNIDKALQRPGRLCSKVEFDLLSREKALKIYKRLTSSEPEEFINKSNISLAEVYRLARKDGWKPPKEKEIAGGTYV